MLENAAILQNGYNVLRKESDQIKTLWGVLGLKIMIKIKRQGKPGGVYEGMEFRRKK